MDDNNSRSIYRTANKDVTKMNLHIKTKRYKNKIRYHYLATTIRKNGKPLELIVKYYGKKVPVFDLLIIILLDSARKIKHIVKRLKEML